MSREGDNAFNLKYHTHASNDNTTSIYHNYGSVDYDTSNVDLESSQLITEEAIRKQDNMLDQLGNIVSDIKHAATGINEEIGRQNDVIDDLRIRVDDADNNIKLEVDRAKKIKKDKKCGWCCMIGSIVGTSCVAALIIALVIYFTTRPTSTTTFISN